MNANAVFLSNAHPGQEYCETTAISPVRAGNLVTPAKKSCRLRLRWRITSDLGSVTGKPVGGYAWIVNLLSFVVLALAARYSDGEQPRERRKTRLK